MSRKSLEIPHQEMRKMIEHEAEEHSVNLEQKENDLINEIVTAAPERMNAKTMSIWSNEKVETILSQHPELLPQAERVRNSVRKELFYRFSKERFDALKEAINREKPEKITPEYIKGKDKTLWTLAQRRLRTDSNEIDWNFVAKKLGIDDKFEYEHKQRKFKEATDELFDLLESKKPDEFGPKWIEDNNSNLYQYFQNELNLANRINWGVLIDMLPKQWRKSWTYIEKKNNPQSKLEIIRNRINKSKSKRTFTSAISELSEKLRAENPLAITPGYIDQNHSATYQFLAEFVYDESGKIDWDLISAELPDDLRKKWDRPKPRYEDYEPKTHYRNDEEIQVALNPFREKLYTLVELQDESDRTIKDEIINSLLALARKGNDHAKEKLMEYLEFTISDWINQRRIPVALTYHRPQMLRKVERSIYLYREKSTFLIYLENALRRLGAGFGDPRRDLTGKESIDARPDARRNGKAATANGNDYRFHDEPTDEF